MQKKAFITGICGQDGFYLKQALRASGYDVYGTDVAAALAFEAANRDFGDCTLFEIDLTDSCAVNELLERFSFDEIYNLAGVSFVPASWDEPLVNFKINAGVPLNLLEAIRHFSPQTRIFQACSSELFGDCATTPQNEATPFHPRSPYAVNKIHAYHMAKIYREYRDVFACCGILYNHESPRRPEKFVTRKITSSAARISLGLQDSLELGSLDALRDWSYAGDTVQAMMLMLQADTPDDYIVASGQLHSVRDFCATAFAAVGLDWERYVTVNPAFIRVEHSVLHGNPDKIRQNLGYQPEISFTDLVSMMVEHDLAQARIESGS